jgi:hypothetical protein
LSCWIKILSDIVRLAIFEIVDAQVHKVTWETRSD